MLDYGAINSKRIIRAEYKSVKENKAAVERIGGVKKRKQFETALYLIVDNCA